MNLIPELFPGDLISNKKNLSPFGSGREVVFYSLGRTALLNGVKLLAGIKPGQKDLLVPAFICEEAIRPLRDAGFKIVFYSINSRFNFSIPEIKSKMTVDTLAIMIVHYFGIPTGLKELKSLCCNNNVFLVEDCAHSFSLDLTSNVGDISFLSIRKFLPTPDGGALIINNVELLIKAKQLEISPNKSGSLMMKFILRSLRNIIRDRLPTRRAKIDHVTTIEELCPRSDIGKEMLGFNAHEGMSELSSIILSHQDLGKISIKRRENYNKLAEMLENIRGVTIPYPKAENGWSPYVLPVLVKAEEQLMLLRSLISNGIMASDWPTLPDSLPQREKDAAYNIMKRIIILPVHQHLHENALCKISKVFREALA